MTEHLTHLIWLDLEMTGLDHEKDKILEIATVVTDIDLNIIETGPELAISQPEHVLAGMHAWCVKQHGSSGLTERVRASTITEAEAEQRTLAFLKKHVAAGVSPMCGNSIYNDRIFLWHHMPKLEAFFHYRNLDVSTLKILSQCWAPKIEQSLQKESKHRALDDIIDSIKELQLYKDEFLKI